MKVYYRIMLCLLLAGCLGGCQKKEEPKTVEEGAYQIYYLNQSATKLVPHSYQTETTDPDALAEELIRQMMVVPGGVDSQPAFTDKNGYQRSKLDNMVLYLYFDAGYATLKMPKEILCRAALAKTLTQINGVDFISIYVTDQPLLDQGGSPVGVLTATDFIENVSDVNAYEKSELTLYFADPSGERLLPEKREVVHNINTSMEKLVLQELIDGPGTPGLYPTLPRDLKVLNVSINEGVCYIDFDATFLNSAESVTEFIPIYSITNSLSELSTISKVQISVNGSLDVRYRDSISLNALFERNLDYIGGTDH